MAEVDGNIVEESDDFVSVAFESFRWIDSEGYGIVEKDYRVGGDVWRVHKNDADPYPSRPHAHCIAGKERYVGCKLHLGTRQLFTSKNKPMDRFLDEEQFTRLIVLIRPKFPDIVLPLST